METLLVMQQNQMIMHQQVMMQLLQPPPQATAAEPVPAAMTPAQVPAAVQTMVPPEGPPPAAEWQSWTPWVPPQPEGTHFVQVEPMDTNPNMFNECRQCHSRTYFKKVSKGPPAHPGTVVV